MLESYPDILTVPEVATILRVSDRTVYEYCYKGAIRHFRLKNRAGKELRRVFIPKQGLLDYLEGDS